VNVNVNFTTRPPFLRGMDCTLPIEFEAALVSDLAWTLWRRCNSLAPAMNPAATCPPVLPYCLCSQSYPGSPSKWSFFFSKSTTLVLYVGHDSFLILLSQVIIFFLFNSVTHNAVDSLHHKRGSWKFRKWRIIIWVMELQSKNKESKNDWEENEERIRMKAKIIIAEVKRNVVNVDVQEGRRKRSRSILLCLDHDTSKLSSMWEE
jgi:hypothetical protein